MKQNCFMSRHLLSMALCASFTLPAAALPVATAANGPADVESTQQNKIKVSGTIVDEKGEAIIGASVREKGSSTGTISDMQGKYTLSVSGKLPLVISYVGYKSQEIPVADLKKANLTIKLSEDGQTLDEMVVIGYGTQRKGDITSAISSIKSDEFIQGNIGDAAQLVKGKVAGLTISKSSGDPNSESTIRLRGIATLNGSTTPLVLIDGIEGGLTTVAPENIESIDVLKDASAAAIYGTRGANGVILITTKSGKRNERAVASYSGYISISNFYKQADFMTAQDIREGKTAFKDLGYDTDWVKAITRTGFTHNHNFNIHGGNENTTYAADLTFRDENGTIKRTNSKNLRGSFDVSHWMLNKMLKVNANLVLDMHNNNIVSSPTYIYRQAVIHNPTAPLYNKDGSYYEDFNVYLYYNPLSMINELNGEAKDINARLTANVTFEPIKGWKTNLKAGTRRYFDDQGQYQMSNYYSSLVSGRTGYAYLYNYHSKGDNLELTSQYDAIWGKHRFSGLVGYSYEYNVYSNRNMSNYNFPSDVFQYNNMSLGNALKQGKAGMGSSKWDNTLIGFFGRVSYGYDDRYNALVSFRHEGSSKFGENHKWGTFPSVSLGWTISNEKFMKNVTWLNNLKLRFGYGVTGEIPTDSYISLTKYNYGGAYFYENGTWKQGLTVASNPNPDLKWEKSREINIGLDFSLFDNRFSGSIDFYDKKTSDMLWNYTVPTPPNLYGSMLANVGKMRNRGFELMLSGIPVKTKDFQWNTTVTISHNSNKLLSLSNDLYQTENYLNTGVVGEPVTLATHRLEVGKSLGNYWGMKSVGVSENGLWLIENPKNGNIEEFSADMLNDTYCQYLGNGFPKVVLGWNNTFTYKNFDLSLQFTGQFGFKILNEQRMYYENNSIAYNRLKSATDHPYGGEYALSSAQSQTFVSYYLEKGDYLKLSNFTFGYNFQFKETNWISKLRLYVTGDNIFCITGYKGLDPELSNSDIYSAGNDFRDKYPTLRTFSFGVNVTF